MGRSPNILIKCVPSWEISFVSVTNMLRKKLIIIINLFKQKFMAVFKRVNLQIVDQQELEETKKQPSR